MSIINNRIFIVLFSLPENVVEELQRHLNRVKIITGSLKIARSFPIVSLDFFQNLEEIRGIHPQDPKENKKHYSITIMENENLQKLFSVRANGKSVQIYTRNGPDGKSNPGRAFVHYNPKLCRQEIKNLLKNSMLEDPGENSAEISYATNGDKAVCSSNKLNLTVSFQEDNKGF
jgi:insulin receptor